MTLYQRNVHISNCILFCISFYANLLNFHKRPFTLAEEAICMKLLRLLLLFIRRMLSSSQSQASQSWLPLIVDALAETW